MDLTTLNEDGLTLEEFLAGYDPSRFERPSVTVDMAVLTDTDKILLIRRKNHPNIGSWALPGGFVDMCETPHAAACRELMEETGVTGLKLRFLGVYGEPTRDPRTRVITTAFSVRVPESGLSFAAGDDAADAGLFSYSLLPMGKLEPPERSQEKYCITLPATACGEPLEGEGDGFLLTLECGNIKLAARLGVFSGVSALLGGVHGCETLAGDHPLIIFDALKSAK